MLKLDNRFSNNQAEQLAILKALEDVHEIHGDLQRIKEVNKESDNTYGQQNNRLNSVSYTHLDVYKRQKQQILEIPEIKIFVFFI